jgi:predicted GNAT family N-acyltransferase
MEVLREKEVNGFLFSTDKNRIDVACVHHYLSNESYWAKGIPLMLVQKSIDNSICIGIYDGKEQVGFARVITDGATFGYLADVFIAEASRGKGLSKELMKFILSFEELKVLRRIVLATRDAHGLYAQFGFKPLAIPDRFMELHQPDIYKELSLR